MLTCICHFLMKKQGRWRTLTGLYPDTWNPFVNMDLNHFWHLVDEMGNKVRIGSHITFFSVPPTHLQVDNEECKVFIHGIGLYT